MMVSTMRSRSAELFEGPLIAKRPLSGRSPLAIPPKSIVIVRPRPLSCREELNPIEVAERKLDYKVVVPLSGIDPRKIYVIAKPQGIVIEFRLKSGMRHANSNVAETTECRISKEFTFPSEIKRCTTIIQVCGDSLHITARKAEGGPQDAWSELIHFDTRGSLGCV